MPGFDGEVTDPGRLALEIEHLRERCDERGDRTDIMLVDHGRRINSLELLAAKVVGAWFAVTLAAGVAAAAGSFIATWFKP